MQFWHSKNIIGHSFYMYMWAKIGMAKHTVPLENPKMSLAGEKYSKYS